MEDNGPFKGRTVPTGNEPFIQQGPPLKLGYLDNTRGIRNVGVIGDTMYTPTRASTKGRGGATARAPLQEISANEPKLSTADEEDKSLQLTPGEPLWPHGNSQRTNQFAGFDQSKRDSIAPPRMIRNADNNRRPMTGTAPVDSLMRRRPTLGSSFDRSDMLIYRDDMTEVKENLLKDEQDMSRLTTNVAHFLVGSPPNTRSSSAEIQPGSYADWDSAFTNLHSTAGTTQVDPQKFVTNAPAQLWQRNGPLSSGNLAYIGATQPAHTGRNTQGVSRAWANEIEAEAFNPIQIPYRDDASGVPSVYNTQPILSNYPFAQTYIPQGQSSRPKTGLQVHDPFSLSQATARVFQTLPFLSLSGFHCSPNYKGNWMLTGNQSANIPEIDSSSVWITNLNLPLGEVAYHELLFAVRGCGKVYACVVNPPDPMKRHTTSAAKMVFFDKSGALELFRRTAVGEFVINGYVPKVVYNRIRTASQQPSPVSRVIHIEGPKQLVNYEGLSKFFSLRFTYQIDEVITLSEDSDPDGLRRLEWRFGSYRCQAATAVTVIDKLRREIPLGCSNELGLWRQVNTYYAVDPCAVMPILKAE